MNSTPYTFGLQMFDVSTTGVKRAGIHEEKKATQYIVAYLSAEMKEMISVEAKFASTFFICFHHPCNADE